MPCTTPQNSRADKYMGISLLPSRSVEDASEAFRRVNIRGRGRTRPIGPQVYTICGTISLVSSSIIRGPDEGFPHSLEATVEPPARIDFFVPLLLEALIAPASASAAH